jgi:hypothetical protein
MLEDTSLYFDASLGMGEPATLAGVAVVGIFDAYAEIVQGEAITLAPTFLLLAAGNSTAAEGQTLARNGSNYRVRQVLPEPPDGTLLRLVLVRV